MCFLENCMQYLCRYASRISIASIEDTLKDITILSVKLGLRAFFKGLYNSELRSLIYKESVLLQ